MGNGHSALREGEAPSEPRLRGNPLPTEVARPSMVDERLMANPALPRLDAATPPPTRRSHYLWWLWGAFAVWWIVWAIRPKYLTNWMVENALLVACIALLFFTRRRFPLSNVSYTLIVI